MSAAKRKAFAELKQRFELMMYQFAHPWADTRPKRRVAKRRAAWNRRMLRRAWVSARGQHDWATQCVLIAKWGTEKVSSGDA